MKKDIEWLKAQICIEMMYLEHIRKERWSGVKYQTLRSVYQKINQLDEAEVLSLEWIDKHKVARVSNLRKMTMSDVVPVDKLQDLLVPKQVGITEEQAWEVIHGKYGDEVLQNNIDYVESQGYVVIEKPTIPQFVADWIEDVKPDNSLRVAFGYIAQRKADNHDDPLAFWIEEGNSETFARAWIDGYEVEEEQKYRVLDGNTTLLGKINGLTLTTVQILEYYPEYAPTFDLTEQEIKDYDERYMNFAVKVEEVE